MSYLYLYLFILLAYFFSIFFPIILFILASQRLTLVLIERPVSPDKYSVTAKAPYMNRLEHAVVRFTILTFSIT